jgi:hypothetical protein
MESEKTKRKDEKYWENLGIKFSIPSEEDFEELREFYMREFVPGWY